jgi:hypothetical protein
MASVVDRMHSVNPALNAIVFDYSERALAQAAVADNAIAKGTATGRCMASLSRSKSMLTMRARRTPTG